MTYKINDTVLSLQPSAGKWLKRAEVGRDGYGHPIYVSPRQFEISWELISPSEFNQIQTFFNGITPSGTVSIDLPIYGNATYAFKTYSGVVIDEPYADQYFNEYQMSATLLVSNIRG